MVSDSATLLEIRDLLARLCALVEPVSDAHVDQYLLRQAERQVERESAVRRALSTSTRRRAWELADGNRTVAAISREAKLDPGDTSRLFKALREAGAIVGAPNPKRAFELTTAKGVGK